VAFSTEARAWREALAAADESAVKTADGWVGALEARGGTAIEEALATALKMLDPKSARPAYVVFITDGAPTIGERDPDRLLDGVKKQMPANARIFCVGVGEDLNSYLVDKLADDHRGAREYVTGNEDVEQKISAFYDKIAFPVMTDLKLELVGLEALDVYPKTLPDLFRGSQLTVLGRYKGGAGQYAVRVTGKVGGETHTLVYEGDFGGKSAGGELLPRLWAVRKIGYLLEEIRLRGETPEVKAEVVRLSKLYGVMTPYTSYLVVEDEVRRAPGDWREQAGVPRPATSGSAAPTAPGGAGGRAFGGDPAEESARADAAKRLRAEDGGGIRAGEELDRMKHGYAETKDGKDDATRRVMRTVGEKTFYRDGEAWVDAGFDPAKAKLVEVQAYSDAYWKLLKDHAEAAKYLALGERVTVVLGGTAYRVAP
jgi:Ca-activated chloride channel family protein